MRYGGNIGQTRDRPSLDPCSESWPRPMERSMETPCVMRMAAITHADHGALAPEIAALERSATTRQQVHRR